jgi:hypothetical protein
VRWRDRFVRRRQFFKARIAAFEQPGDRGSYLLRDRGEICASSRRDTVASLTIK